MHMSRKTFFRISCSALALLFTLSGLAVGAEKKKTKTSIQAASVSKSSTKSSTDVAKESKPSDVMAKVNGVTITRGEVDRAVKVMLAQSKIPQPVPADIMKKAEGAALNQLVSSEVLYQAGSKLEIKDLDKQVDEQIAKGKARFPSPAEYDKAVKEAGFTDSELKTLMRKEIVINNLLEKNVADKVKVGDDEVKKFYEDNKDKFKTEESVRASHILIGVDEKASDEDKKKAKEKAEAIRKQLLAGADFATLAKKDSTCPSAKQGCDLGFFTKEQMVPEFANAAFALKPGEISDVVKTKFGYHIIKLQEKKPAGIVPFDEAKGKISEYLKSQKIQKGVNEYLEKLRKDAKIEMSKS
jgi:peptidyl-prolyl cis-trans isomerase C